MQSVSFFNRFLIALILGTCRRSLGDEPRLPCNLHNTVTRCYNVEILDHIYFLQGIETSIVLEITNSNLHVLNAEVFHAKKDWEVLYLARNGIATIHRDAFSSLGKVVTVNLEGNLLTKLDPRTFTYCYLLDKLTLSHNPLTLEEEEPFLDANQLKYLDISFTNITDLPLNTFKLLLKLRYLNISHNLIKVLDSEVFARMLDLEVLDVTDNQFKVIDYMVFLKNSLNQLINEWNCDCDFKIAFYEIFRNITLEEDAVLCSDNTTWMEMEGLECNNHVPNEILYNNIKEYRAANELDKQISTTDDSVMPLMVILSSVIVVLIVVLCLVLMYWFMMRNNKTGISFLEKHGLVVRQASSIERVDSDFSRKT